MQTLVVPPDLRARLVNIARAALPHESCGFVAGVPGVSDTDQIRVERIEPVANALASPVAFALDGQAMIAAETRLAADGYTVVGVFHSHPAAAAVPSARDLDDASLYDPSGAFVHVIVSMQGFAPTLRAWRLTADGPVEVGLQ